MHPIVGGAKATASEEAHARDTLVDPPSIFDTTS